MPRKGIPSLFIVGLMIIVLLILSGILSIIVNMAMLMLGVSLGLPDWAILVLVAVISVLILGWVFTTFMVVKRKGSRNK